MKPITVISCFDGMSGGQIALERAGIPVAKYYAFEIDKYAIKVAQHHYPDTVQLGNINKWEEHKIPESVDLFLAGFPCQAYSNAGKGLGLQDFRGQLIYPMLQMIDYYLPKYFLLENVKGLTSKRHKAVYEFILKELRSFGYEVHVDVLNSSLVSAQNRERLYITNFPFVAPEDKGILLKDIIGAGEVDRDKSYTIDANYWKGGNPKSYYDKGRRQLVFQFKHQSEKRAMVRVGTADDINGHDYLQRIYSVEGKSPTLVAHGGGNTEPKIAVTEKNYRKLTVVECERLQTVDDDWTKCDGVSNTQRYKMLGNGWTIDMITHLFNCSPLSISSDCSQMNSTLPILLPTSS